VRELSKFPAKVTLALDGDEVSLAWREGTRDDLLLAVAVAV
jgi:hypothetical protein